MSFFRGYLEICSIGWNTISKMHKMFFWRRRNTAHSWRGCPSGLFIYTSIVNGSTPPFDMTSYQLSLVTKHTVGQGYESDLSTLDGFESAKFNSFPLKSTYNFHSGQVGTQSLHVSHSCLWFSPDWTAFYVDIFPCQNPHFEQTNRQSQTWNQGNSR